MSAPWPGPYTHLKYRFIPTGIDGKYKLQNYHPSTDLIHQLLPHEQVNLSIPLCTSKRENLLVNISHILTGTNKS